MRRILTPRLLPALVACVLTLALVTGALRAGSRWFFCPEMGQLAETPCCAQAPAEEDADTRAPAIDAEDDCCRALRLGALPNAAIGSPPAPIEAPFVALVPPVPPLKAPDPELLARTRDDTHVTAPPPTAQERCAREMVFLL